MSGFFPGFFHEMKWFLECIGWIMSRGIELMCHMFPTYDSMMQEKFGQASMLPALSVTQFQPGTIAALPLAYKIYIAKLEVCHAFDPVQWTENCNRVSVLFQCTFTAANYVRYLSIAYVVTLF